MTSRYHDAEKLGSKQTHIAFQHGHAFYRVFAFLFFRRNEIDKEGRKSLSQHVESFSYHDGVLCGEVHASMKKKVYKVTVSYSFDSVRLRNDGQCVILPHPFSPENLCAIRITLYFKQLQIYLDEQQNIKTTECECPRGAFKCSHTATLFIHGIYHLSRTNVEYQWRKRKSSTSLSSQAVSELFPLPKKYCALLRSLTHTDRSAFYEDLKKYGKFTGLCWLLSPEPPAVSKLPMPSIEEIIYSDEFLRARGIQEQLDCLVRSSKLDEQKIVRISEITVGQRNNPAWHIARRGRLTASNFGSVLDAKRITPSLLKRLLGEYDLSRVKAIQWGVDNEEEAIRAFTLKTGKTVKETGIWFDSSGILGASPDGIVDDETVLETKCPYTERNVTRREEALKSRTFCPKKSESGCGYVLKREHVYWHQVQGEMYFSRRKFCYFVVWTRKDVAILLIQRDDTWAENIPCLLQFYHDHLFPKVVEGEL